MLEEHDLALREKVSKELEARLGRVRESGFESMASLQVSGVTNLSVPVFGPIGTVIAALTCPYTERLDKKDAQSLAATLKLLVAAGHEISQRQDGPANS